MESCLICDKWNETPHAKRYTTPIPPQYAEEAMVIGYWLGSRQGVTATLCERHKNAVLSLDRRTAPTTPPPPPMPQQTAIQRAIGAPAMPLQYAAPLPVGSNPQPSPQNPMGYQTETGPVMPLEQANLRRTFFGIAQTCAAEYAKQHPALVQAQAIAEAAAKEKACDPAETDTQLVTNVPPDVLRQALADIAEHTTDPNVAQFAARVLDGTALPASIPPPPAPTPQPGTIPCAVCHRPVKPGEVHACS